VKAVFDTNIFVAAFVSEGICARLLRRARKKQVFLYTSTIILEEFQKVLSKKLSASPKEIKEALKLVEEAVEGVVEPSHEVLGVCRDADDDRILACALAVDAKYLVTGDEDLLILKKYKGIRIVSPRDFELLFAD